MKRIQSKRILMVLAVALVCLSLPMLVGAQDSHKVYRGYHPQIEAGKVCPHEGESRCVEDEMIFRCQSGQWQPKEVCFWGCKTHSMCRI